MHFAKQYMILWCTIFLSVPLSAMNDLASKGVGEKAKFSSFALKRAFGGTVFIGSASALFYYSEKNEKFMGLALTVCLSGLCLIKTYSDALSDKRNTVEKYKSDTNKVWHLFKQKPEGCTIKDLKGIKNFESGYFSRKIQELKVNE